MKFLIIVVVALSVAFVVGARMGVIDVPGLSPAAKKAKSSQAYGTDADPAKGDGASVKVSAKPADAEPPAAPPAGENPATSAKQPPAQAAAVPEVDPLAGQKSLAKVWQKVDAAAIASMIEKWPDAEVAKQFAAMPAKQVGEILSLMKPERASKLSHLIQTEGLEAAKRRAEEEAKG